MRKPVTEEEFGHRFRCSMSDLIKALRPDPPSDASRFLPALSDLQGDHTVKYERMIKFPTRARN